jgi:hypothetical protein
MNWHGLSIWAKDIGNESPDLARMQYSPSSRNWTIPGLSQKP